MSLLIRKPHWAGIHFSGGARVISIVHVLASDFNPVWSTQVCEVSPLTQLIIAVPVATVSQQSPLSSHNLNSDLKDTLCSRSTVYVSVVCMDLRFLSYRFRTQFELCKNWRSRKGFYWPDRCSSLTLSLLLWGRKKNTSAKPRSSSKGLLEVMLLVILSWLICLCTAN